MKTNAKGIVAAAIACALTAGSLAGVALANPIIKIEDTIENSVSDWHRKDDSYDGEG